MLCNLELYPHTPYPTDVTYDELKLYMFCIGSEWRLPTREERWNLYQIHKSEELRKAWFSDITEHDKIRWTGSLVLVRAA